MDRGEERQPRVLSAIPGRLRVHLPSWHDEQTDRIEAQLRQVPGVEAVQANPLTGNVLIHFNPRATSAQAILATAGALDGEQQADDISWREETPSPASSTRGGRWLRAGLRGLLGHALVDTAFYTITFAEPFGLPLAGLGVLHLGLDVLVWTAVLAPLLPSHTPHSILSKSGNLDTICDGCS
jgi:hypothetical protein